MISAPLTRGLFIAGPLMICCLVLAMATAVYPPVGLILLCLLLLFLAAVYDPVKPLLLAFFLLPFDKLTVPFPPQIAGGKGVTILSTITLPKIIILFTLLGWITKSLVLKREILQKFSGNFLPLAICVFFIISFSSILKASAWDIFFLFETRLFNLLVMFFLLIALIDNKFYLQKILKVQIFAYSVVGLMGLYEIITQTHLMDLLGFTLREVQFTLTSSGFRVIGPYGDPDVFSRSMVYATLITLFFLNIGISKKLKVVLVFLLLLFFFNILGGGSRGALLAYLGSIVPFWFLSDYRHKWSIGILALVLLFGLLAIYTITVSERTIARIIGESGTSSISFRIGWMKMAFEILKDNPILGIGTGNFLNEYNRYIVPQVPRHPHYLHNTYLQVMVENGLLGFLAYGSIFVLSFLNLYKAFKRSMDPVLRLMAKLFLSLLLGLSLSAATSNVLPDEVYWLVFTFSFVIAKFAQNEAISNSRR